MQVFLPSSVSEALEIRRTHEPSHYLGGGTLINGSRWSRPGELVCLTHLGLEGVETSGDVSTIGAMTTLSAIERSGCNAFLAGAIHDLGRINIRNAATIGGVIGANQAFSDVLPALFVLDARVETQTSPDGSPSSLGVGEYLGLRPTERGLILRVLVPKPAPHDVMATRRFARNAGDVPTVKVACRLCMDGTTCSEAFLALGATGVTVRRLHDVEALLSGRDLSDTAIHREAAKAAAGAVKPAADVRGLAPFKKSVVEALVADVLALALGKVGEAL